MASPIHREVDMSISIEPKGSLLDVSGRRSPYPFFTAKRAAEPVWHGTVMDYGVVPPEMIPDDEYTLFTYPLVSQAFREHSKFSSSGYDSTMGLIIGPSMLGMTGQKHRDHRNLVSKAFRAKSLARWEPEFIVPICAELIDDVTADGSADLVEALTFEFPTRVIARLLGLPADDLKMFRKLSFDLISIQQDIEAGFNASMKLATYFREQIEQRRSKLTDDIIGDLVSAEIAGEKLDDDAIITFLRLLLPAGLETTYRSSGNLLYLLLTHPDQLAAVRENRDLITSAIEEGLRFETPLVTVLRQTTEDVQVGGTVIPAGATVDLCVGSANRDEDRWPDSDKFDIFRPAQPHISFAAGIHSCLGLHLARMETRIALTTVLDRLNDLDLATPDVSISGLMFRSPAALPVTFTRA
jgi:cytochrome P450